MIESNLNNICLRAVQVAELVSQPSIINFRYSTICSESSQEQRIDVDRRPGGIQKVIFPDSDYSPERPLASIS